MIENQNFNNTEENIQCRPINIVKAGNNLTNIFIIFSVFITLTEVFVTVLLLYPPSDYFIPTIIGNSIMGTTILLIMRQIRNAGRNLKNSYFSEYNGSTLPLGEIQFHKDLLKKKGYTSTIIQVEDKCPACNHPIKVSEDICSDCGLVF